MPVIELINGYDRVLTDKMKKSTVWMQATTKRCMPSKFPVGCGKIKLIMEPTPANINNTFRTEMHGTGISYNKYKTLIVSAQNSQWGESLKRIFLTINKKNVEEVQDHTVCRGFIKNVRTENVDMVQLSNIRYSFSPRVPTLDYRRNRKTSLTVKGTFRSTVKRAYRILVAMSGLNGANVIVMNKSGFLTPGANGLRNFSLRFSSVGRPFTGSEKLTLYMTTYTVRRVVNKADIDTIQVCYPKKSGRVDDAINASFPY